MDEFDKLIANLRRLRTDLEHAGPPQSTDDIVKKIEEIQRRIDAAAQTRREQERR